jgi:hypothetical protein
LSQRLQIAPTNLAAQIQPIDIEAFRNLVDPAEDEYLRRRLPPAQFRSVQRERLRAAAAYIQTAGRNAGVLVRLGQSAFNSSDTSTAAAARQLVERALLLRRNCAFALIRIYVALAWPNGGATAGLILAGYEQLNGSAMLLGRLQNPAAPVRISATL